MLTISCALDMINLVLKAEGGLIPHVKNDSSQTPPHFRMHERTEKKQVSSHGMFQRPCLNTACSLASLRRELDIQASLRMY
jgi:hypothetical protein